MNITNANELRKFLASQLNQLKDGKISAASANAMSNLSGKILSSVKLELEYNKLIGNDQSIGFVAVQPKKIKKLKK